MSKIIPGIHHSRRVRVLRMRLSPNKDDMVNEKSGPEVNGVEAASYMSDGELYYIPSRAHIVYLRWDGIQYHTVAVDIQNYIAPGNRVYSEFKKEIAIYLSEGLHPDEIFDILAL